MADSEAPIQPPPPALPTPNVYITGHTAEGKSVIRRGGPAVFGDYDHDRARMAEVWTTTFPSDLRDDRDVALHEQDHVTAALAGKTGLVNPGGTLLRYLDLAPGYTCMMHRTVSVDYIIVLSGKAYSVLDSGEETLLQAGDIVVQRATMHAFRNPTESEWVRMVAVLQDCRPPVVDGKEVEEDLGSATGQIPSSGKSAFAGK